MQIADKIDSWLSRNNEAKILEDGYGRSLSVPLPNHSASKTPWILVEIQQEWMESKLFGEVQTCWLSSDYRFWWWQKHNFLFFDSLQPRLTLPSGWTNSRESCDQNEFSNHSPLHFPIFRSHARKSYHRISQRSETRHIAGAGDIVFGDPGRLAMAIAWDFWGFQTDLSERGSEQLEHQKTCDPLSLQYTGWLRTGFGSWIMVIPKIQRAVSAPYTHLTQVFSSCPKPGHAARSFLLKHQRLHWKALASIPPFARHRPIPQRLWKHPSDWLVTTNLWNKEVQVWRSEGNNFKAKCL